MFKNLKCVTMEKILGIVLMVSIFLGVEPFCLNGWTRRNDSCYLFEDLTLKNWQQADQYCRDQDGHLVVIDSNDENTWLQHEIRKLHPATEDQFWTAGNDRSKEGTWVWGNSGDSIMTTYWYPGEPNQNGGEEDCVTFYTRYNLAWNDEHCDKAFPFICEMEDIRKLPKQNVGEEDCVTFYTRYNHAWNDKHCDKAFFFICEMEDPETSEIIG